MAKFCGHCGSPLNEQGLCPNCAPASAPQQAAPQQVTPQQAAYYTNMPQPAAPKKKVNKKVLIPLIAGAAALVIVAVVLIVALSRCGKPKSGGKGIASSQYQALVSTSYGKFSGRCNITAVGEQETSVDAVKIEPCLYSFRMAQDGDTFYGIDGDNDDAWKKITVTGKNNAKSETWVDENTLNNSVIGNGDGHFRDVGGFTFCGSNVIAYVAGSPDFMTVHKDENYRIIRVDKSGKNISFVGDDSVRAYEMTAYDGWIYYMDNGYYVDGKTMKYDDSRVGVYKIKPDGSGKTRIFGKYEGASGKYDDRHYGNAGGLTIIGNWLYFCDLSDNSSRLARMHLDGSGYEQLTTDAVSAFTVDAQHNKVYYRDYYYNVSSADHYALYALDLNSQQSEVIAPRLLRGYGTVLTYDNGYVYLMSLQDGMDMGGFRRLQVDTGKRQVLKMTRAKVVTTEDEYGNFNAKKEGIDTLKWEDLDSDTAL